MIKKRPTKSTKDWHRADIVAALHKRGWSLRRLAKHHGYKAHTSLIGALHYSYPKAERYIASAIGIQPEAIWPSRYQDKAPLNTRKRPLVNGKNQRRIDHGKAKARPSHD